MKHRAACLLILTFLMCMIFTGTAYASDSVPPENDVLKIGISMKSSTDAFCKSCKSVLDLAGQALDVKFEYIYCGETPEGVLTSVEQLSVIGVKGIVLCGVNEEALGDVIDLCNKKKIYMAMALDTVTKEDNKDLYKKAQKSKFVIGAVHGEESESGAAAAGTGETAGVAVTAETAGTDTTAAAGLAGTIDTENRNPTDPLYAFFMVYNAAVGNYKGFGGEFEDVLNHTQLPEQETPVMTAPAAGQTAEAENIGNGIGTSVLVVPTPTPAPVYTPEELRAWAELSMDELKNRAAES